MNISKDKKNQINHGLKVVADLYSLQIIAALREESLGFNQLQKKLDDISPTTLSSKLKALVNIHMLESTELKNQKLYSLTTKGKTALPIYDSIYKFISEEI
jgi:DNA-binding HxlR family transcriptional regulator